MRDRMGSALPFSPNVPTGAILDAVIPVGGASEVPIVRSVVDSTRFNRELAFPYELRAEDFQLAMQDAYDFFFDVNSALTGRGLGRFDDMLRPAAMSGILSDMLTASMAKHARALTENQYFNGHPDLIVTGKYPNDSAQAGEHGIEIKTTRKRGGAVDTHGVREQWMCVFVYKVDNETQPIADRVPMEFTEVYLAYVTTDDFRRNPRGELGTRTATLHRDGVLKLRQGWVYR